MAEEDGGGRRAAESGGEPERREVRSGGGGTRAERRRGDAEGKGYGKRTGLPDTGKRRVRERKGGGDGMKTRIGVRKGIAEVLFPLCERRRAGLSAA